MTRFFHILLVLFIGCSPIDRKVNQWQNKYLMDEQNRIVTTEKSFNFRSGDFKYDSEVTHFERFNKEGRKLSYDNTNFFQYDSSGKIVVEEFCDRQCETPYSKNYYYDSSNRLAKITLSSKSHKTEKLIELYSYSDNKMTKKIYTKDSLSEVIVHTYDTASRIVSVYTSEFNSNTREWIKYIDSFFYDNQNHLTVNKRQQINKDLLVVSKFVYNDNLLQSEMDTTITTNKEYLNYSNADYSVYYNKTNYKYNSDGKLIEKTLYKPDYKTPYSRSTYSYK